MWIKRNSISIFTAIDEWWEKSMQEHIRVQNEMDELRRQLEQLNKNEKRCLEYFWDKKRKEIRESLSYDIIVFLETEGLNEKSAEYKKIFIYQIMAGLEQKKYLLNKQNLKNVPIYEVTKKGQKFLLDKHPSWTGVLDKFIERRHPIYKVFATILSIIGTLISIHEIYQAIT